MNESFSEPSQGRWLVFIACRFAGRRKSWEVEMTRKAILFTSLALVALAITTLFACKPISEYLRQVYKAYGKVVEDGPGAPPLESVEVFLHPYQYSVLTNGLGDYGIELSEGTWTLDYVKDGYDTQSKTVTVNAGNPRFHVEDIKLVRSGTISIAQATKAAQTVAGTVSLVCGWDERWSVNGSSVSFSTAGLRMTGTKTETEYGDISTLTITLSNYSDSGTGYTANGSVNVTVGGVNYAITADVTLSGGPVTTMTWNVNLVDYSPPATVSGTITCNGISFDANALSAASTANTVRAWQAMFDGLIAVMVNASSWTVDGLKVSYSTTGLSMAGTRAVSGNIETTDVTITYSSYASNHIYALNGVVHFVMANDTSSSAVSLTFTVDLALSGGPVTTLTCSNVVATGALVQRFVITEVTGKFVCNGTAFDAKTMSWND